MRRSSRLVARRSNEKPGDVKDLSTSNSKMPVKIPNTSLICEKPESSRPEKRNSKVSSNGVQPPRPIKFQKLGLSGRFESSSSKGSNGSKEGRFTETMDMTSSNTYDYENREPVTNNDNIGSQDESKENIKAETSYASDSDADQDESLNYLKMREKNMKANEDFFASLGINKAKEILQLSSGKKKPAPSQRGLKLKKEPKEPLPSRKSLRIRRVDPVGNPLPDPEPVPVPEAQEPRLPSGPVPFADCVYSKIDISDEEVRSFSSSIYHLKPEPQQKTNINMKTFLSSLENISMNEDRVAKVVPGRVFSVTWHPSPASLLAIAGDKYGHIGIWNVGVTDCDGQDIVRAFRPHIKPVSDLVVPTTIPHKLFSCSYDATLRCADFEHRVFNEIFSVPEDDDDLLRNMSFLDANTMLVSQFSGNVSLVDTRTPTTSAEQVYPVSRKSLRTVSVHPLQRDYFITAGIDTNINLWDLRSMKTKAPKSVQTLEYHTKSISSAYFSPSGSKILSCSADDTIMVCTVDSNMKMVLSKRIRHNNFTGRWLTNFKPTWHPNVEDVFISGSMSRPREIQVFDASGSILRALTDEDYLGSVCSLNAFHPNKTCTLVGANSSGRLHVFM